jgi:hypothetical protein
MGAAAESSKIPRQSGPRASRLFVHCQPVPRSEASMPKTFMRPNRTPVPADEKAPNSLRIPEPFPGGYSAG